MINNRSRYNFFQYTPRTGLYLWLLLMFLLSVTVYYHWPDKNWLKSTIDELATTDIDNYWQTQAENKFRKALAAKIFWLIETPNDQPNNVMQLAEQLDDSRLFKSVNYKPDTESWTKLYQLLSEYRYQLISQKDHAALETGIDDYLKQQLSLIFTPAGAFYANQLEHDPAGLFLNFSQQNNNQGAQLSDNAITVNYQGKNYALLIAELKVNNLQIDRALEIIRLYSNLKNSYKHLDTELYATGVPLFSAYGTRSGHNEVKTVGSISIAAIIALLLATFRSPRPILLTLLVIAAGTAGGLVITVIIARQIHIVTFVFGAAVIGVSVDYAFHYLCGSLDKNWTADKGLSAVLPGLTLGFLSSCLAFLCLTLVPIAGVKHIGLFMASGLSCSWLTVVLACPALMAHRKYRSGRSHNALLYPARFINFRTAMIIVIVLASLPGLFQIRLTNDIRILYAKPDILINDERFFQSAISYRTDSRYIEVSADSKESLLRNEEQITAMLEPLIHNNTLVDFRAISKLVPSSAAQKNNIELYRTLYTSTAFKHYLRQLGFNDGQINKTVQQLNRTTFKPLTIEQVSRQLPQHYESLFLGCYQNRCASAIQLVGINDLDRIQTMLSKTKNARLIDKVQSTTALLEYYRNGAAILIMFALLITSIVLTLLKGLKTTLYIITTPVLAIVCSLAFLTYLGQGVTLFTALALVLVMGVSIDYAIFMRSAKSCDQETTLLAITLSAITTSLAFGLLCFSETPAIQSFGVTLIPGLITAYLLAASSVPNIAQSPEPN